MFRAWCETWNRDVLVWPSSIEDITNSDRGIILGYACPCGNHGQMLTGSSAAKTTTGHTRP